MKNQEYFVRNVVKEFRDSLSACYPPNEINQYVYMLFENILGWTKPMIHINPDAIIPEECYQKFSLALNELRQYRPIQYILGKSWFNGCEISVDSSVLIPRPETEELCLLIKTENSNRNYQDFTILDIGTGSGSIAIYLSISFPYSRITAIDISPDALDLAQKNSNRYNCKVHFCKINILNTTESATLPVFDLIVSNPPYVLESEKSTMPSNVREYEPTAALFVPDNDPLRFYKAIVGFAQTNLANPGLIYFEIHEKFGREIQLLLQSCGFEKVKVVKDIHGKDRFIRAEKRMIMLDSSYWYDDKSGVD